MAQNKKPRATKSSRPESGSARPKQKRRTSSHGQNPYEAPYETRASRARHSTGASRPPRSGQGRRQAPARVQPSHAREPEPRRGGPVVAIIVAVLALVFVSLLVIFFLRSCGGGTTASDAASQGQAQGAADATTTDDADSSGSQKDADATDGNKTAMSEDGRLDLLVLVNKEYELPEGWEDKLDLVGETNIKGEYVEVDRVAYDAFKELAEDLEENEGITFQLNSGYRSVEAQQEIWDWLEESEGEEYARTVAAEPGHSEHHTGLAIDALLVVDGEPMVAQDQIDAHDYEFGIMYDHLAKHGFVLRYLEGKESITGYDFAHEKWHIRYVGVEAAEQMMAEPRTTLEEYLGKLPATDVSPAE